MSLLHKKSCLLRSIEYRGVSVFDKAQALRVMEKEDETSARRTDNREGVSQV